mgnify:CR=1 FL=1
MTLAIVAVTCAITFAAWRSPRMLDRLVLFPPALTFRGQWDRLLGYGLVHADMWHLLFNMLTLLSFGAAAEAQLGQAMPTVGSWLYLALYVSALPVSIWPSYARHRQDGTYVSLGASGAVSAVLAFVVARQPSSLVLVFGVPMPGWLYLMGFVAVSVWLGRRPGSRVNHQAHIVGTGYGLLAGLML